MTMENLDELRERLLREDRVQQMVRARAYEIYQMRGGQPGWESHDWFQAEGEVLAFLIAHESRRQDERAVAEPAAVTPTPQPPTAKPAKPRSASRVTQASKSAPKKPPTKRTPSKKPESRPKAKAPQKSSAKEEGDR